jgi:insulysin
MNTNYYFNVGPPALPGALARFSGFFHSPLFSSSGTARELNAVDSEHKKNHQNDVWRIFQVNKHLSKDGHVWRKFGTGNQESLTRAARELKRKGLLSENSSKQRLDAIQAESTASSRAASPALTDEADGGPVGRETRRRLVEWWSNEYCASRMRLAVVGKGLDCHSNMCTYAHKSNRVFGRLDGHGRSFVCTNQEPWQRSSPVEQ